MMNFKLFFYGFRKFSFLPGFEMKALRQGVFARYLRLRDSYDFLLIIVVISMNCFKGKARELFSKFTPGSWSITLPDPPVLVSSTKIFKSRLSDPA